MYFIKKKDQQNEDSSGQPNKSEESDEYSDESEESDVESEVEDYEDIDDSYEEEEDEDINFDDIDRLKSCITEVRKMVKLFRKSPVKYEELLVTKL